MMRAAAEGLPEADDGAREPLGPANTQHNGP